MLWTVRKVLRYRLPKQVVGLRAGFQDKVWDAIDKPLLSQYARVHARHIVRVCRRREVDKP
jgi:hypothetical protein